MGPAAVAIGWEFRRRQLWTFIAMGIYMLVLALAKALGAGPIAQIALAPPDGRGAVLIAPVSTTFMYYLAVFSFGFSGDLAARRSIFPARLFTLPVRTEALVLGPMLHGVAAVAILVQTATLLTRWSWGMETPFVWPALLAAVFLAWTQALIWMPYGLRGMRVVVTVLWLVVLDVVVLLAVHFEVSEPVMLAILAPQLPLAYLTACHAVERARRGEVPDWRPRSMRAATVAHGEPRSLAAFASPDRAQLWYEWRRHGRTLPVLVGIVLPVELALFWLARDAPGLVLELLVLVLISPPLLASVMAASVSKEHPDSRDPLAMSPFTATRPLSCARIVGAKLRMAAWSTVVTWMIVLVAVLLAIRWSGTWPIVELRALRLAEVVGLPRTIVLGLLVLAGLVTATWAQLVQSLCIGLSGREWIMRCIAIAALLSVIVIGPALQWVVDDDAARVLLWRALPVVLAALVALKMLAAGWIATRLVGSGLMSDRTILSGATIWIASVFALYGVLAWLASGPLTPQYFLVSLAILGVPLARVSATPLVLAWNRHR